MDNTDGYKTGRRDCRTGHTLRRICGNGGRSGLYRGQFSIHKMVRAYDENHSQEEIEAIGDHFADWFDDGGLEKTNSSQRYAWQRDIGMLYSQNKRKRWLLSSLLRDNIHDAACHKDLNFKVVLEERELTVSNCFGSNYRADCIRVCESQSDQPEKLPTKKYSYATDLRRKDETPAARGRHRRNEVEEDPTPPEPKLPEICYEMCYPKPEAISAWKKCAHKGCTYDRREKGCKSRCKGKGVKNDRYRWHGFADEETWARDVQDEWDEEIGQGASPDFKEEISLPCGLQSVDILECLRKKSDQISKGKKRCKKGGMKSQIKNGISTTNQATSNPVKMHGKSATIYEEQPDTNTEDDTLADDVATSDESSVSVPSYPEQDVRFTHILKISTPTISQQHLKKTYGGAYIESKCHPRRFAIDIAHESSYATTDGDVYVLFENVEDDMGNLCYRCNDFGEKYESLYIYEYTSVRVSLIISPQFYALHMTDFTEVHAGIGEKPTVANVIRWLADMVNDKMSTISKSNSPMKTSKHRVTMDTITKASGWKLRVDTPYGVYQVIQQKSKSINQDRQDETGHVKGYSPFCGICFESLLPSVGGLECTALTVCGHWFCNECWNQHLRSRVNQGDFNILCPGYNCKSAVDIVTKMSLMSNATFFRHIDHMRNAAITRKTEWQWCPNPKCGRMACVVGGSGGVAVNCQCGWLWCSQCMLDAHWPATCKQAAGYMEMVKTRAPKGKKTRAVIESVEVKHCPSCKYPMEKNGGCPHMICRMCGCSFCWRCLGLWNEHKWQGINSICPKAQAQLKTVMLQNGKTGRDISLLQLAMNHRDMRSKSNIKKYQMLANRLVTKEFLKVAESAVLNSKSSKALPTDYNTKLTYGEGTDNLPITWALTQTKLASLIEMASQGQQCVQICVEAHFVLEYLAIYMSDNTLKKADRKRFKQIASTLQFVTQRIDEMLNERSNWRQARLLTQSGRSCLKKLACAMNNLHTMDKNE